MRDPDIKYGGQNNICVARYTLAIDRAMSKDKQTDFISCKALGKNGEFAEKYLKKGMKIIIQGEIQTGNYKDKDGRTVYTTDVMVTRHEFAESKNASQNTEPAAERPAANDKGFMDIPDGLEEELPFA